MTTYLGHNRPSTDHGTSSNCHERQNDDVCTNKAIVVDLDGSSDHITLAAFSRTRIDTSRYAVELDIMSHHDPASDVDVAGVLEVRAAFNNTIFADVNIVSILAPERRLHDGMVSHRSDRSGMIRVLSALAISSLVRLQDLGEQLCSLVSANTGRHFCGLVVALHGRFAGLSVRQESLVEIVKERLPSKHLLFLDLRDAS